VCCESKDKTSDATTVISGCALLAWRVFVVLPLWYVLLASLLLATDAEGWQWVLYILYVPAGVFGSIMVYGFNLLRKANSISPSEKCIANE